MCKAPSVRVLPVFHNFSKYSYTFSSCTCTCRLVCTMHSHGGQPTCTCGEVLNAEVEYPCLSGVRRHLPCINFKDSARPAELPRWLSWYSICLERRTSRVRVLPEAALLFLLGKKELSSGVIACICLVSINDHTCTCSKAVPCGNILENGFDAWGRLWGSL